MKSSRSEHTIAVTCQVQGRGYWTGEPVSVIMHPAEAGSGIRLVRPDLPGQPECQAHIDAAEEIHFRTNLCSGAARFEMVEHLLAALAALEIDNCCVEVNGLELPGLDGSSQPYVEALQHAGLIIQARTRTRLVINETFRVENEGCWIEASPSPDGQTQLEYRLSFDDDTPIKPQSYAVAITPFRFTRQLAAARTFVTERQAQLLRDRGVGRHVTNQDLLVFGHQGVIENHLRFPNECARHKTLDMIGDLSLVGADLIGRFVSFRGGHLLNAKMARELVRRSRSTQPTFNIQSQRFAA